MLFCSSPFFQDAPQFRGSNRELGRSVFRAFPSLRGSAQIKHTARRTLERRVRGTPEYNSGVNTIQGCLSFGFWGVVQRVGYLILRSEVAKVDFGCVLRRAERSRSLVPALGGKTGMCGIERESVPRQFLKIGQKRAQEKSGAELYSRVNCIHP